MERGLALSAIGVGSNRTKELHFFSSFMQKEPLILFVVILLLFGRTKLHPSRTVHGQHVLCKVKIK